jgi:hypothetical protein
MVDYSKEDCTLKKPKEEIQLMAADVYFGPFWTHGGAKWIGDCDSFSLMDGREVDVSSVKGLKEWFSQAEKYDPYCVFEEFQPKGFEDWVNKGYELALEIKKLLPKDVVLYYAFSHKFGDSKWTICETRI